MFVVRWILVTLLTVGAVFGGYRYLGSDAPFMSHAWFQNAEAKMNRVIHFGHVTAKKHQDDLVPRRKVHLTNRVQRLVDGDTKGGSTRR